MKSIIVQVGGMSCQHCVKAVERALAEVPGIKSVKVELANARAIIEYEEPQFNLQNVEKAIADQGYDYLGVSEQ